MKNQNTAEADSSVVMTFNLVVYPRDEEAIQYVLNARRICLGRGPGSQIRVNHSAISLSHLELVKNDTGDLEVTDLGSSNGLAINGEEVTQAVLKDGDRLLIGGAVAAYFLILPDDAEAVDPVIVAGDGAREKVGQFADLAERTRKLETEYKSQQYCINRLESEIEKLEAQLLRYQKLSESPPVKVRGPREMMADGSEVVAPQTVPVEVHSVESVNRITTGNGASHATGAKVTSGRN